MPSWIDLESAAPGLATFGAELLKRGPAYLATVGASGRPRVHPVTPILGGGRLFVFMESTSPKGHDLRDRGQYALHNGVADSSGSGGEFIVWGVGRPADSPEDRALATTSADYTPADRYILFELDVTEARGNGYGDVELPDPRRWAAG